MTDSNAWRMPPKRSLPEIVAERIVEAIRSGHLKPGERIVEVTLSKELGVSRGPLREALKVLQANHLLETRARGTYVRAVSDEDLVRMVEVRANLEGFAARFVAAGMTPRMVETLTDLLRQGKAAADEGRTSDWRDLDWRFHETVVALADNPFLLASWRGISNLIWLFLHTHAVFEREVPATLANHDRLFAALTSGDPDRAEHAFRSIILGSAFRRFGRPVPAALASLTAAAALAPQAPEAPGPELPRRGPRIRVL